MPLPVLTRTLYGNLLRLAASFDRAPALKSTLTRHGVRLPPVVVDGVLGEGALYYQPQQSIVDAVRVAFRTPAEDVGAAQNHGLEAMHVLNTRLAFADKCGIQRTPALSAPPTGQAAVAAAPKPGCLLVAHPLVGFYWARSVVLLIDHTDVGSLGVVISPKQAVGAFRTFSKIGMPAEARRVFGDTQVWEGGPVHATGALLHNHAEAGGRLLGDTGLRAGGSLLAAAALVDAHAAQPTDFAMFAGAAAWGAGQLESEVQEGTWTVVDHANPWPLVAGDDTDCNAWQDVLTALGGEYAQFGAVPDAAATHAEDVLT